MSGFYSNHSLRSTCATKLYQKNVDEHLIQEQTGHISLAIRSYKRTCDAQCNFVSNWVFFKVRMLQRLVRFHTRHEKLHCIKIVILYRFVHMLFNTFC